MSNRRKDVIQPMTGDRQQREAELSAGLCDAEKAAVVHILSEDRTPTGLMNLLNNATGFAETMALKLRHPRTPGVDLVIPTEPPPAFCAHFMRDAAKFLYSPDYVAEGSEFELSIPFCTLSKPPR